VSPFELGVFLAFLLSTAVFTLWRPDFFPIPTLSFSLSPFFLSHSDLLDFPMATHSQICSSAASCPCSTRPPSRDTSQCLWSPAYSSLSSGTPLPPVFDRSLHTLTLPCAARLLPFFSTPPESPTFESETLHLPESPFFFTAPPFSHTSSA